MTREIGVVMRKELREVGVEGGGTGRYAIVGAGPRRKVQLARLSGSPALRKVVHERRDGPGG